MYKVEIGDPEPILNYLAVIGAMFGFANPRFQRGARARSSTKGRKVEKLTVVMEDPDNVCEDRDDDNAASCSDISYDDVLPESLEADEEIRLHVMGLSSYFTAIIETNFCSRIQQLPTRYLPPGSIKLLFWQFKVSGHQASYLHFWRVFRQTWHNVLRFQPASSHGQCDECAGYKESFGRGGDPGNDQHRYDIARQFKDHITAVRRDRELETFLQAQRPLEGHGCLAIHWDPWNLFGCFGGYFWTLQNDDEIEFSVASHSRTGWTRASGGSPATPSSARSRALLCCSDRSSKSKAAGFMALPSTSGLLVSIDFSALHIEDKFFEISREWKAYLHIFIFNTDLKIIDNRTCSVSASRKIRRS